MNKLMITRWNGAVISLLRSEKETVELHLEPEEEGSILGNIYIGKVNHIVKNINAAFVDIGKGQMGYLSLSEPDILYAGECAHEGGLRAGDEVVVQVERDAVKTKAPVLTGNINMTGRYFVLTTGKKQIGFSSKITDQSWKREMKAYLEGVKEPDFGIIVRTNAFGLPMKALTDELLRLKESLRQVLLGARYRTCYSLLYGCPPAYISLVRDSLKTSLKEVITDERDIYDAVKEYFIKYQPEDEGLVSFYEDSLLPLRKLYQLEKAMKEALEKRVWLKSGGYLVIEPTEAMVVIDVNTGKYAGKKTLRDTIRKINLEAAEEIGRQLRLRNLSGIIIIDFIDMEPEEDKRLLLERLAEVLSKDPVKTTVVEMTKLNLVEVTRKKIRRPLYEQASQLKEKGSL